MAKKRDVVKKIDIKVKKSGAPLPIIQEDQPVPPAFYLVPAPDTLVLVGQAILRSTQAPLVSVAISWQEAPNIAPDYYNVEWSESSSFTNVQRARASTTSATIDGLKANGVTYYFRVQAVLGGIYSPFSDTLSVVTMTDTTPPPIVTGLSAVFTVGDLIISWTNPNSEIFKDVKIDIYNAGRTTLYATLYTAAQQLVWSAEENLKASLGVGVTSVSIDVTSRSWTNTLSAAVNTTATSAVPTTPSPTFNWTGDNGTADEDLKITWARLADATTFDLTLDGTAYQTQDLGFTYTYERNVRDHTPTLASGDPSITYVLRSRNKLGQQSVAASGTVTNAAPPSGVMGMSVTSGFSSIAVTVAFLGQTIVQDFDHFEYALTSGSTTFQSFNSPDTTVIFQVTDPGSYVPTVRAVDKFNQRSALLSGPITVMDTLTIAQLRAETKYLDSLGATSPVLDFYKDGFGGPFGTSKAYTAVASGTYQWIEAQRPLLDRYKTITFEATYAGIALAYFSLYNGSTTVYYSGPVTASGTVGQRILTRYTNETTAKANAIRADLWSGYRFDLSRIEEARTVRVFFSNYGGTLTAYEYYPRRIVQSDDIEAESIRTINLAAGSVVADRISVINLSAINANIGKLTITDGLGGTAAWLYQGTGTGDSPTTGIKIWNSAGLGKVSGYNSGVEQITIDTDGKLKWGAGTGVADASGIYIIPTSSMADLRSYGFKGTNWIGGIYATEDTTVDQLKIWKKSNTGKNSQAYIEVNSPTAKTSSFTLFMTSGLTSVTPFYAEVTSTPSISTTIDAGGTNGTIILASNTTSYYDITVGRYLFIANASRKFYDDGTYTRFNSSFAVDADFYAIGNIYWGTGGNFLSAYINQTVLTTSSPTFAGLTISGSSSPTLTLTTSNGSNHRTQIAMNTSGLGTVWLQGVDVNANNGTDWFLYYAQTGNVRVSIGAAGNVGIEQKLYIGAIGVTPTALIHLASDSALKPTTTTWQTTSTKQAKDNIKTRDNALDRIKKLRLTDFEYNGKHHTTKGAKGVGFIAEEAKQVYPNAVEEMTYIDDDGVEQRFLALNPHEIFMDYASAIQELEAKVALLESKIK